MELEKKSKKIKSQNGRTLFQRLFISRTFFPQDCLVPKFRTLFPKTFFTKNFFGGYQFGIFNKL